MSAPHMLHRPGRRSMAAAGLLAVAALVATGCSSDSGDGTTEETSTEESTSSEATSEEAAESGPVTITFMEAMSSGTLKDALAAATDRFEEANPDITVELVEQPDYGTLNTKIEAEVAAGNAPTLAQVYGSWAVPLADSGVIVSLDDRVAESEYYDGFYEGIKANLVLADGETTWMWPFNKSLYVQYYNENMVQEAPTTWDEFAETARAVSTDGVVAVSVDPGGSGGIGAGTQLVEILAEANGGGAFDDAGEPTFTDPALVEALQYFVDLKNDGALATGANYPGQQALGAETGAFDLSTVAGYTYNLAAVGGKFEMGVAPMPAGSAGEANSLSGTNLVMFADATPEQQDAAWQYMEFLTSPAEMAAWAAATGYLPISEDAKNDPAYADYLAENPWVEPVIEQLESATSPVPQPWTNEAQGMLAAAVAEALAGSATPEDALSSAQDAASALVE